MQMKQIIEEMRLGGFAGATKKRVSDQYFKAWKKDSNCELQWSERGDCVVRAFSSAFDISYKDAHEYVRTVYNRKNGRGTQFQTPWLNSGFSTYNPRIGEKQLHLIGRSDKFYSKADVPHYKNGKSNFTIRTFLEKHPKGKYLRS